MKKCNVYCLSLLVLFLMVSAYNVTASASSKQTQILPVVSLNSAGFSSGELKAGEYVKAYVDTTNSGTQKYKIIYKVFYSPDGIEFKKRAASGTLYQTGKNAERLETRPFKLSGNYKKIKVIFEIYTKQKISINGKNPIEIVAFMKRPVVSMNGAGFNPSVFKAGDYVKAYVNATNTSTQRYKIIYKIRYSTDGVNFNRVVTGGTIYQSGKNNEILETRQFKISEKYKKVKATFCLYPRQPVDINGEEQIEIVADCGVTENRKDEQALPIADVKVNFPQDEGVHKAYNTEWWYINLDLKDKNKNTYRGFLAVMRRVLSNNEEQDLIYIQASDVKKGISYSETIHGKLVVAENRLDLTFKGKYKGRDFILNWKALSASGAIPSKYRLWMEIPSTNEEISFIVENKKRPLYEGEDGIIQIAPNVNSYYYSLTDLGVELESTNIPAFKAYGNMKGKGWFDHQWFSIPGGFNNGKISKLPDGVSHEWFSVQLNNGTELVFWDIGFNGGSPIHDNSIHYKYLGIIDASGKQEDYYGDTVEIKPLSYWTSKSGEKYANKWEMKKGTDINLIVSTQIPDQLVKDGEHMFYEGGTAVRGKYKGRTVSGSGFAEMTRTY